MNTQGFGVAVGVDVEIVPSAGNAAAHELAVVLEVHGVDLLAALVGADLANALDHILALFRRGHQLGEAPLPVGIKWKYQENMQPFSISRSRNSSDVTTPALARV